MCISSAEHCRSLQKLQHIIEQPPRATDGDPARSGRFSPIWQTRNELDASPGACSFEQTGQLAPNN
jgi:hypothetical protein